MRPPLRSVLAAAAGLALALAAGPGSARAAPLQQAAEIVRVVAKGSGEVPAGGKGRIEIALDIGEGWHVYGPGDAYDQQTRVAVDEAAGLGVGAFTPDRPPKSHVYDFDPDMPRMEYAGEVTYGAEVSVPGGTPPGERTLTGTVEVNVCNDQGCLPPAKLPFRATVTVVAAGEGTRDPEAAPRGIGAPVPPPRPAGPPAGGAAGAAGAVAGGGDEGLSVAFLLAAMGAGLLTILTPCVFPMLPLTVSILSKKASGDARRNLSNAFVYSAGMFVSLAGIGLLLSLVFGIAPTSIALSPWFNLGVFLFLLYLALSLFGAYDIQLPAFLTDWAQGKTSSQGGTGLFFMGVLLAFTSFACAAPFAGALLVASPKSVPLTVVGMVVYAATFSAPFFLLALFPGFLQRLPESGGWLNAVKVVMGFVEVAVAFKFLRQADIIWEWGPFAPGVFTYDFVLAIWVACALGASLYLLGFITLPHDTKVEGTGIGRLLWSLFFLTAALFLLPGLFGRPLPSFLESFILPDQDAEVAEGPGRGTRGGAGEEALDWKSFENDLEGALAAAKAAGKPVFLDFTGVG